MMPVMRQNGFTLVELSIVLAIIGLLLGSVIGGMAFIQNAKVASVINLSQDASAALSTFKQQYHMLPGDMVIAPTNPEIPNVRTECWTGANKGNNNGLIDSAAESQCVPEVLFHAGLVKVDQDGGWAVFKTSFGPAKIIATSLSNVVTINGSNKFLPSITHVIEFANLPCEVAQAVDRKIDNDDLSSGKAIASGVASGSSCAAGSIVAYYAVAL